MSLIRNLIPIDHMRETPTTLLYISGTLVFSFISTLGLLGKLPLICFEMDCTSLDISHHFKTMRMDHNVHRGTWRSQFTIQSFTIKSIEGNTAHSIGYQNSSQFAMDFSEIYVTLDTYHLPSPIDAFIRRGHPSADGRFGCITVNFFG